MQNGYSIPSLGLGTYLSTGQQVYQAVKDAIEIGYRHVDTAFLYDNEKEIGRAVNEMIRDGKVKREDLFIVTKVWNTYHSRSRAYENVNKSLNNLGLDYIDLVLIHWPFGYDETDGLKPVDKDNNIIFTDIDYLDTWKGLEDAVLDNKVKSIGVSNFNSRQLERVISRAIIKPVVLQVCCMIYNSNFSFIHFVNFYFYHRLNLIHI